MVVRQWLLAGWTKHEVIRRFGRSPTPFAGLRSLITVRKPRPDACPWPWQGPIPEPPTRLPRPAAIRAYAQRLVQGESIAALAAEPGADELACLCAATMGARSVPQLRAVYASALERRRAYLAHWLDQGQTLAVAARVFGLTRERVRQVLAAASVATLHQRQRAEVRQHLPTVSAWVDDPRQPITAVIARIRSEFPGQLSHRLLCAVMPRIRQRRARVRAAAPKLTKGMGDRLRLAMRRRGINQTMLAQRLGKQDSFLTGPFSGRCSMAKIEPIAKALNVPALWLWTGANMPAKFAGDTAAQADARRRAMCARLMRVRRGIFGRHGGHGREACAAFGITVPQGKLPMSAWKRAMLNPEAIIERVAERWAVPLAWLREGKGDAKVQRMIGGSDTATAAWRARLGLPARTRRRPRR